MIGEGVTGGRTFDWPVSLTPARRKKALKKFILRENKIEMNKTRIYVSPVGIDKKCQKCRYSSGCIST
jgi:hypothetical protein